MSGGSWARTVGWLVVPTAILLGGSTLSAQEDFRSLDAGRPLKVTDAFPKKYLEWEFQSGLRGGWAEEGRRSLEGLFELETGLFRNFEIGTSLELATRNDGANTTTGFEALEFDALYNFKHEGWTWPAVAVQTAVTVPTGGDLSREDWAWGGDLLLTRSFASRLRLHFNGGYFVASEADGDDYWRGGLAFDIPIGLSSRLIAGDLYTEIPINDAPTRVWAELGTRLQVSNVTVIDIGLTTRLDEWRDGAANVGLIFGLSYAFGIGRLVPVPEYPNPRIR